MMKPTKKAHAEQVLGKIVSLNIDACEVQLCLAALLDDTTPDIQRLQITGNVVEDFRGIVKKLLARRRKEADTGDIVLKEYDPQAKMDSHEIEHLDLKMHDTITDQLSSLTDIETMAVFKGDDEFVGNLRFYVIVLRPKKGEPVFLFRGYTPKRELSRSPLFGIVLRAGEYDRLTEKTFLFDQHVDCMIYGDDLFIFHKDGFQKIFRFYEMLLASAQQTLQIIQQRVPIDDFEAFESACSGHLQKLSKLKNIASKPYLQSITMADLKKVIKKYDLPIQTVGQGKDEKIAFDPSDKWAILRLLDDDYLESLMTGESYEVNSKRLMT